MAQNLEFEAKISAGELNKLLRDLTTGAEGAAKAINDALGGTVTKKLVLQSVTDASGARSLVAVEKERLSVATAIENQYKQIQRVERGSVTSLRQQVNEAKQARDQIAKYNEGIGALGNRVRIVTANWETQNAKVRQLQRSLDLATASGFWDRAKTSLNAGGLISFANGLTQITNGLQSASIVVGQITGSINNLVNTLANLQSFALAFEAIGAGASGGATALRESSRIALNLGTDLTTVRDGFRQLTPVILNSGGTINDVSNIVEALSSRFAAFGISGDRARRVTNGVIQAFAKGKLQAEELTQQISEADPAFKTDFAGALRVTVQELESLVKAGGVTSEVLLRTLPSLSKASLLYGKLGSSAIDAVASLEKGNVTIDQVRNKIQSLTQLNLESFSALLQPVINSFLGIGAAIVDFTTDVVKLESLKTVTTLLAGISQALQRSVGSFLALAKAALTVIEPIAKLANAILSIPGAAEALGFALVGNLLGSLAKVRKSFIESSFGATAFGQAISKTTDFGSFNNAISNLIRGNRGAQLELTKTSRSVNTLGRASEFVQGRIAVIGKEIDSLRAKQAAIAGKSNLLGSLTVANETDRIQRSIASLTGELNRYESILPRVGTQLEGATSRFNTLNSSVGASGNIFARAGLALGGIGKAVAGGFGLATGAIKGFLAALGPVGIALAAVAVLQSAYANATKEATRETERTQQSLEEYDKFIKEVSGSEPAAPKLDGLALAWESLSLDIADALDSAKDYLDDFANYVQGWSIQMPQWLQDAAEAFDKSLIGKILASDFKALTGSADSGGIAIRKFERQFGSSVEGVAGEVGKIKQANQALAKLASESDGSAESQARLTAKFKTQSALVQGTRERYDEAQKSLERFKASLSETPTEEQSAKLKKLQDELNATGAELRAAEGDLKKFGEESSIASQLILEATFSISGLNEKLKELRQKLEQAIPGTDDFAKAAVDVAALEAGLDLLSDQAKDPIELSIAVPARIRDKTKELEQLLEKQAKIIESNENLIGPINTAELEELQKKIAEIGRDLDNLELLRRKVAVTLILEDQEFKNKIQAIESDKELTTIRLNTTVDQPQLRKVLTDLATFSNGINALFEQQQQLRTQQADPTLGLSERLALAREEAVVAKQIETSIKKGAVDLRDSASTLVKQLQDARASLLNLKLGNLSLLPAEAQKQAIQELNKEIEKISKSRGLKVVFRGTEDEILKAKQAWVSFYGDLQKGEQAVSDTEAALGFVEKAAQKLADAGLEGVYETINESIKNLSSSTATAATNAEEISKQLFDAATQAVNISNAITSLDGFTANVRINGIPARWSGGPVSAGSAYQVNELGQEGFLSAGGRLSAINRPKNALWRAPSSGTVIPAHIWSGLDVPRGGVSTTARPMTASGGGNGLQRVVRAIQASLGAPVNNNAVMHEMAVIQARQAVEIGKLSRAVNKLADKDHTVNVSVRNTGSTAYLEALNGRL